MLEEAEKRDHRKLGRELDLFHIDEVAPGVVFWHPKGWALWQAVEQYMRRVYRDTGYQEVKGPQILDKSLWEKTGHWQNYRENMFTTESEKREYALKPMNCPGHVLIFKSGLRSYRDLPIRYGEFGQCHRNEPTRQRCTGSCGCAASRRTTATSSAPRTRSSTNASPTRRSCRRSIATSASTDIIYKVATRPDNRIGSDELWDKAEHALMESAARARAASSSSPRATAPSTGRRSNTRSRTRSAGRGSRHDAGRFQHAERLGADYVTEDQRTRRSR